MEKNTKRGARMYATIDDIGDRGQKAPLATDFEVWNKNENDVTENDATVEKVRDRLVKISDIGGVCVAVACAGECPSTVVGGLMDVDIAKLDGSGVCMLGNSSKYQRIISNHLYQTVFSPTNILVAGRL
jgi:hypothetical protein